MVITQATPLDSRYLITTVLLVVISMAQVVTPPQLLSITVLDLLIRLGLNITAMPRLLVTLMLLAALMLMVTLM